MLGFRQFVALARLTTRDTVRQPVCILLMLGSVAVTALVPVLLLHRFGEDGKLVRDSALSVHAVFGLLLTGYAASTAVAGELRRGTAQAVLSKPVGRDLFFAAKYAGVAGTVLLYSLCATLATLLSDRVAERFVMSHRFVGYVTDYATARLLLIAPVMVCTAGAWWNYRRRRPFGMVAALGLPLALAAALLAAGCFDRFGDWAPFAFRVQWRLVPASLLVTLSLLVTAALALSVSVVARTGPTLVACGGVFGLGLLSESLFGRLAERSLCARLLYNMLPDWQHFWMPDALNQGGRVPGAYVAAAAFYAAAYTVGLLALGTLLFRRVDVAGAE